MLHPRLTPVGGTIGGSSSTWLATVGPMGAWSDLAYTTRWGDGACGNYEASWTMPLPPGFSHPLLRRGTLVELMDGPYRVGSPFVMSEPAVGAGFDDPWTITCSGIGREVEGENSFYCFDSGGNTTTTPSTAVDQAIVRGLRWSGRDATVSTTQFGAASASDALNTVAALLNAYGDAVAQRWRVKQDNVLGFKADPTTPTYHVTPGAVALGTADENYATVVLVRYLSAATHGYATAAAPSSVSATETRFGRKEYPVDVTSLGEINASDASGIAAGILAKAKGRLAWTNGLTLTSNELLTSGDVPASLSKVAEDVGDGCMVRVHGLFSDLLESNGQTWLDLVIGEAKYVDGAQTIDLSPAGLAPRDLASIVEEVSGVKGVAA